MRQSKPEQPPGFERLLAGLDADRDRAGELYLSLRGRLVSFFAWRAQASSEECADEVIERVTRKLDRSEEIADVSTYMIGVARMVLLEFQRGQRTERRVLEMNAQSPGPAAPSMEGQIDADRRGKCLRRCLAGLPPESRQLLVEYYTGEQRERIDNRKRLAQRLGVGLGALRIRVLRLRERLEECLIACLDGREGAAR